MSRDEFCDDLIDFLDSSPTAYHASSLVASRLERCGFVEVDERVGWKEIPRRGMVRRDGAIICWIAPDQLSLRSQARIYGAHSDSPAMKMKPRGSFEASGFTLADIEVYGGALLHTWFDRDLKIAGRLVCSDGSIRLVETDPCARISSLAIHLDRGQSDQLCLDRQRDLMPIIGLEGIDLNRYIASACGCEAEDIVASDLYFVSAEKAQRLGCDRELLASSRMDNLLSVYCGLRACEQAEVSEDLQIFVVFEHEEIGSGTISGACGTLLESILKRITAHHGYSADDYEAFCARSICLSADVTHAHHPMRAAHYDPHVFPQIAHGPTVKWSAAMRYATDAVGTAEFLSACRKAGVNDQVFVNHGNIPGGSTIGSLVATRLGIRNVDAGIPILSMHSVREVCAWKDCYDFTAMVSSFLEGRWT